MRESKTNVGVCVVVGCLLLVCFSCLLALVPSTTTTTEYLFYFLLSDDDDNDCTTLLTGTCIQSVCTGVRGGRGGNKVAFAFYY